MSAMIGKTQSLMCCMDSSDNTVYIDTPNKQVKEYYKGYGIAIPEQLDLSSYVTELLS